MDRPYVAEHLQEDIVDKPDAEIDCLNRAIRTSKIIEADCRLQKLQEYSDNVDPNDDDMADFTVDQRLILDDIEAQCQEQ